MYVNAQHMTEHSVDEILHHKNHKNQSREFILDKLRRKFKESCLNISHLSSYYLSKLVKFLLKS